MDPPYYNTFTGYNSTPFGEGEQINLKNFVDILTDRGCKVALSNSNHPFIRELYKDYRIVEIPVKRVINSKASERRTCITELLIMNY